MTRVTSWPSHLAKRSLTEVNYDDDYDHYIYFIMMIIKDVHCIISNETEIIIFVPTDKKIVLVDLVLACLQNSLNYSIAKGFNKSVFVCKKNICIMHRFFLFEIYNLISHAVIAEKHAGNIYFSSDVTFDAEASKLVSKN